jgi:hypothetical protein
MNKAAWKIMDALERAGAWVAADALAAKTGLDMRLMRKAIVENIRSKGLRVLSGPRGYKIAQTDEEIERAASFMRRRAITGIKNFARIKGIGYFEAMNQIKAVMVAEGMK